jgi:hypothetical protein
MDSGPTVGAGLGELGVESGICRLGTARLRQSPADRHPPRLLERMARLDARAYSQLQRRDCHRAARPLPAAPRNAVQRSLSWSRTAIHARRAADDGSPWTGGRRSRISGRAACGGRATAASRDGCADGSAGRRPVPCGSERRPAGRAHDASTRGTGRDAITRNVAITFASAFAVSGSGAVGRVGGAATQHARRRRSRVGQRRATARGCQRPADDSSGAPLASPAGTFDCGPLAGAAPAQPSDRVGSPVRSIPTGASGTVAAHDGAGATNGPQPGRAVDAVATSLRDHERAAADSAREYAATWRSCRSGHASGTLRAPGASGPPDTGATPAARGAPGTRPTPGTRRSSGTGRVEPRPSRPTWAGVDV